MTRKQLASAIATAILLSSSSLANARLNMGMAGDSLTDDYLGGPQRINTDLAAYSWGQVLAAKRSTDLNFGTFKPAGDLWDSKIRYSGWEYNWATSGGVASNNSKMRISGVGDLPVTIAGTSYLSTQVANLATMITNGTLDTVYVGIGANDIFYHMTRFDTAGNFYPDKNAVIDQAFIDDIASSILAGVDTLRTAAATSGNPVHIVLGLLPPGTVNSTSASTVAGVNAINALLIQGAAARGIPAVDIFGWTQDPTRVDPATGTITVGHLQIVPGTGASDADIGPGGLGPCDTTGCALPSHANNFAADDGLHPNTIPQALIANQILGALNSYYGESIPLLTDAEILGVAGVALPFACQEDPDGDGIGSGGYTFMAGPCPVGTTSISLVTDTTRLGAETGNDNCPYAANETQIDTNADGQGDVCQGDGDNDTVADGIDNCPAIPNTDQLDSDIDGLGDGCDTDDDNDGVVDSKDLWPLDPLESADNDGDGIGNNADTDDDNDTIADGSDNCPFVASADITDTDSDGLGNVCDLDDDNDETLDAKDAFPLDATEYNDNDNDGTGDNADLDDDNDGVADLIDIFPIDPTESLDNDVDGKGNNADLDDDNDGTSDLVEVALHTDPLVANPYTATTTNVSFEKGVPSGWSQVPLSSASWQIDNTVAHDGIKSLRSGMIGNSQKAQIEHTLVVAGESFSFDLKVSSETNNDVFRVYVDGVSKLAKAGELDWQTITVPVTPGSHKVRWEYTKNGAVSAGSDAIWIDKLVYVDGADVDSDNIVNAMDSDNDNDGVPDASDAFPLNAAESVDTDNDGTGNNADTDDDGDGVADTSDAFPLDTAETMDTDSDGTGNNADTDDDGDGVADSNDAFPLDVAETRDSDSDGIGNNGDNCPYMDNADQADTDGDNIGDSCDLFVADALLLLQRDGSASKENAAASIAVADMNGDGLDDLLVGVPQASVTANDKALKKAGAIRIVSGADGTLLDTLEGTAANQRFGTALAVVADQNSDSVPDLVVGEPLADITVTGANKPQTLKDAGRVALYSGADGALLDVLAEGSAAGEQFGAAVAAGDINGDGDADLLVGAPRSDANMKDAGAVLAFNGLTSDLLYTRTGEQAGEQFGAALAIDSTYRRLLVGSPMHDNNSKDKDAGRVLVFDAADGSTAAILGVVGSSKGSHFGAAVAAAAGDIDNDGIHDWAVGAPLDDGNGKDAGSVTLYSGLSSTVIATLDGAHAGDNQGTALDFHGDLNRDGKDDLAIGAGKTDVSTEVTTPKGTKTVILKDAGSVQLLSGAGLL